MEDLVVDQRFTIPGEELVESFSTPGGPGGRHADRSASRVTLGWQLRTSAIEEATRLRIETAMEGRLVGGELRVTVDESRSQWRNRRLARRRLAELVSTALRSPAPQRRPTRPSRRRRQERVAAKRRHGETKRLRRPPRIED